MKWSLKELHRYSTRAGRTEEELRQRSKGDPVKLATAARLRQETTMTLKWIAARLEMGACTSSVKRRGGHQLEEVRTRFRFLRHLHLWNGTPPLARFSLASPGGWPLGRCHGRALAEPAKKPGKRA